MSPYSSISGCSWEHPVEEHSVRSSASGGVCCFVLSPPAFNSCPELFWSCHFHPLHPPRPPTPMPAPAPVPAPAPAPAQSRSLGGPVDSLLFHCCNRMPPENDFRREAFILACDFRGSLFTVVEACSRSHSHHRGTVSRKKGMLVLSGLSPSPSFI